MVRRENDKERGRESRGSEMGEREREKEEEEGREGGGDRGWGRQREGEIGGERDM